MADKMLHTPQDMRREYMGRIARYSENLTRCAMENNYDGVKLYYGYISAALSKLKVVDEHVIKN